MLITIIAFFIVLGVLVLVHELGHFITARAFGVKVDEFGIGFPPRIASFKRGETVYSVNSVPLGGFVKLAGEEDPKVEKSLAGKSYGARILVLSAGSLMNLLLPLILFSIAFSVPHDVAVGQVSIEGVAANSPAASAGIEAGDIVLEINGNPVRNIGDVQRNIQLNLGNEMTVLVQHSDMTTERVEVVPRQVPPKGQGAVGIQLKLLDPTVITESYPPWEAVPMGVREGVETLILFKNGIVGMIIGTTPVELTGPVGIAQITGEAAKAGISPLLEFAAFLSINLAIINIFPLPALDGGRVAFVLLEWVRRGKRVSPKTEGLVHTIGFILLMAFILVITYQDVIRMVSGGSPLP